MREVAYLSLIFTLQPTTYQYHLQPTTSHLKPATYNLPPTTYHPQPTTYNLAPTTYYLHLTTYNLPLTTSTMVRRLVGATAFSIAPYLSVNFKVLLSCFE